MGQFFSSESFDNQGHNEIKSTYLSNDVSISVTNVKEQASDLLEPSWAKSTTDSIL